MGLFSKRTIFSYSYFQFLDDECQKEILALRFTAVLY